MSGTIPSFLNEYNLIVFLNLSHNNIQGEVPKDGLFSNVSRFSVVGNLRLCGGIQALHLRACPRKISGNKKKTIFPRMILVLFLPLAVFLACLSFIIYLHRKSKWMNNVHVPVLQENQYPRISYQDIQLATEGFSLNNLLGVGRYGSVHKGTLKALEQVVAVKVLNVELRGANKSFLAECETLRNIRYRNLMKIITTCSSTDFKGNDFKALVFEFMTNGSLDNWLNSSSSSHRGHERNLTLLQRLSISIDVALGLDLGLDYLHHHSHTTTQVSLIVT
ncbi:putative LRR receptor-like serine/threonine-protein kinase At3g47570 [Apium graveolens]|uniref:putative LRR receptor-like serine/threonine-protein kinase At3g47570 n=1 Tax=Apium graveolens TaxID=4045 RepID=UPI003D7A199C